jgi:hypothetical protein
MADYRDVMNADASADNARSNLEALLERIEYGLSDNAGALTLGLAALAVCEQVRALGIRLDYLASEVVR